jgi:hypothetical protein
MSARLERSGELPDGSRYEMVAWEVPESDRFPEGVKYRFQYMGPAGVTLLRYDNFPDHPDAERHHKHTPSGVEAITFTSLESLATRFINEVQDIHE